VLEADTPSTITSAVINRQRSKSKSNQTRPQELILGKVSLILDALEPMPKCQIFYQFTEKTSTSHAMWNDNNLCHKRYYTAKFKVPLGQPDAKDKLFYRRAAGCNGIKQCNHDGCHTIVPTSAKHTLCMKCNKGEIKHVHDDCPVTIYYWIEVDGPLRFMYLSAKHFHPLSGLHRVSTAAREIIFNAVSSNPTLTAHNLSLGMGLPNNTPAVQLCPVLINEDKLRYLHGKAQLQKYTPEELKALSIRKAVIALHTDTVKEERKLIY
jgi:hypothetical protein